MQRYYFFLINQRKTKLFTLKDWFKLAHIHLKGDILFVDAHKRLLEFGFQLIGRIVRKHIDSRCLTGEEVTDNLWRKRQ